MHFFTDNAEAVTQLTYRKLPNEVFNLDSEYLAPNKPTTNLVGSVRGSLITLSFKYDDQTV